MSLGNNWVFSLDQVSQWWGPGLDTSLILSNNAIATPALRLSYQGTEASDLPGLNWLGPMNFTSYVGVQEHSTPVANNLTWGARLSFRPLTQLEVGLSRTAQWGGQGRPTNLKSFTNLLLGRDNVGQGQDASITIDNEPGNQLAGIDLKWCPV